MKNTTSKKFHKCFATKKPVIAMLHVPAMPGTVNYGGNLEQIYQKVMDEAEIYVRAGVDALLLENMHDTPYLKEHTGDEVTAVMSIAAKLIKKSFNLPTGVQILAAANKQALAVALAAGLDFVRAEGFVYGHIADEGYIDSNAGELLRYRKQINAENILVFTDIKKKHSSHAVTSDVSIAETAITAEFFLSDGLVVTGTRTSQPVNSDELSEVRRAVNCPILIGSGITPENIEQYYNNADGFIVGSYFKKEGLWSNPIDEQRVKQLMDKIHVFRVSD